MARRSLTADTHVYEAIRREIMGHRLTPGTQLVELELAARLGVSRTPIRTAMKRLEYEGLVEYRPNRGHTVAQPTADEVREAFWLREKAEGLAAAEATRRIRPEDITVLTRLIEEEEAAFSRRDKPEVLEVSGRFHGQIALLSGNRYLHRLVVELNQRTAIAVALYDFFVADPPQSPREHREVVAALATGNPEHARLVMEEHIRQTLVALRLPAPPGGGM